MATGTGDDAVDPATERVATAAVDAAYRVRRALGVGLYESVYRAAIARQLELDGFCVACEVPVPVEYAGLRFDRALRIDIVAENRVLLEVKAVDRIHPNHIAQVLTYLRFSGLALGLLVNCNAVPFGSGVRRLVWTNPDR